MKQSLRWLLALLALVLVSGAILGIEALRARKLAQELSAGMQPGDIPIYFGDEVKAAVSPSNMAGIPEMSFVDDEDGKTQQGWLLRDVLLQYFSTDIFSPDTQITVSSSSREKSITLTWEEIANVDNMVLFDLSGRGTLKLVSKLEQLDVRDEWIQDTDKIEIHTQ